MKHIALFLIDDTTLLFKEDMHDLSEVEQEIRNGMLRNYAICSFENKDGSLLAISADKIVMYEYKGWGEPK